MIIAKPAFAAPFAELSISKRTFPTVVMLASLVAVAMGVWAMIGEGRIFLLPGNTSVARVISLDQAPVTPGLSTASLRDILTDCALTLASPMALELRYQTQAVRDAMAPRCLALAKSVVLKTPMNSFAWYVGAHASARLQDWHQLNFLLQQSQKTGPSEQWIAELRVNLGEHFLQHLDPDTRQTHDRDLAMLVQSHRGVEAIALRYVRDPDFRDRIVSLVEALPAFDQQRFLFALRTLIE